MRSLSAILSLVTLMAMGYTTDAQTYPADFAQQLVANGISSPTAMAFAPDGRIFVAQQGGSLRVVKNNALIATPFVSLSVNSSGERGLIGITLDPDFATNNYIYLYYTVATATIHNRISRFTANGDVVLAGSEVVILELDPLTGATNHNGGAMHFGKDGKLYVAIGENATPSNAQSLDTYHGKLLRINKDGSAPADNPFPTGTEQRKRVWAYGLRNPYTFSVHPSTGRILVNDVGQNTWEEINDATTGGKNFGWPTTEGLFNEATNPTFTNPIYAYSHGSGDGKGCAITGGTFFYPTTTNYPAEYSGRYFLQDLCNNWINSLDLSDATPTRYSFATAIPGNSLSITTGNDGNLYYLSRNAGALYKIIYNNTTAPSITNQPANVSVAEGQPANFSVSALGALPLSYQWRKDGVAIPGAGNSTYRIASAVVADNGEYSVVITNNNGSVTSANASLAVIANSIPVAEISTPVDGTLYVAGTAVSFSGKGMDTEDGSLLPPSLTWNVNFHHDTHKHDEPPIVGVANGIIAIPDTGETSANVWYRIILTVTDSDGLIGKDSVDIHPRTSNLNFVTSPPGLEIALDGQPTQTPFSVLSVEGILRSIGATSPQVVDDVTYEFESWSNGGPKEQTLATPTNDLVLTAQFSTVVGVEKNSFDHNVSVFPNPSAAGQVTVRVPSTRIQPVTIRMVDVLSREVSFLDGELRVGDNEFRLNHGKLRTGVYAVIVEVKGNSVSRRLLVIN